MANRFLAPIVIALTVAVLALAGTSAYNSWVSATAHSKNCARNDLVLDTIHDLVILFFTPPKGTTETAAQIKYYNALESQAFTRIDLARC